MLVLSRKAGTSIRIGENIELVVTRIERRSVRLAIKADPSVRIVRGELQASRREPAGRI